jgi:manganese-dependent inorganic pyrophosphatase
VNPDLDGVASSIAVSLYLNQTSGIEVEPVFCGRLDAETAYVLELFHVPPPKPFNDPQVEAVYLVDTHEPKQLDGAIQLDRVIKIWDHHPLGDPSAFPNAQIINEQIGAVATFIAELIRKEGLQLDRNLAALLYAAIVSNTLNFNAPTTTERDKQIANWLAGQTTIPAGLAANMFEARSEFTDCPLQELLSNNYKDFDFSGTKIGISQIEGVGITKMLLRPNLETELGSLRQTKGADHVFLSAVDVVEKKTYVMPGGEEIQKILSATIGAEFSGRVATFNRILLRKSDLIPPLKEYFANVKASQSSS